jgi:fructokinase
MKCLPGILCFGESLWDLFGDRRVASGAPMNVALRLAQAGFDVSLLTRVGTDSPGTELIDFMAAGGLPTQCIQRDRRQATGTVVVDTTDRSAPAFDIVMPVAWDFIDARQYLRESPGPIDVLVFGSLAARHAVSRRSLLTLTEIAGLKIFDVNFRPPHDRREIAEPLLQRANWAKLNETELARIAEWHGWSGPAEDMAGRLAERYGLTTVCVTLGDAGALLLHDGEVHRQHAFEVEVVDTVGCGDAFLGTLLSALLSGTPPPAALARASAVGALVAASPGATPEIDESAIRRVMRRPA